MLHVLPGHACLALPRAGPGPVELGSLPVRLQVGCRGLLQQRRVPEDLHVGAGAGLQFDMRWVRAAVEGVVLKVLVPLGLSRRGDRLHCLNGLWRPGGVSKRGSDDRVVDVAIGLVGGEGALRD